MFCKNCGNQINPNAVACLQCGCDPKRGNLHCNNCGVDTNPEQIICVKCGVSLKSQSSFSSNDEGKTVAIISYLTLIGFIIALTQHNANKTKLGAYHLRHVLGFMVTGVGLAIILYILSIPTFFSSYGSGMVIYAIFISFITFVAYIGLMVCIIISLINAVNGLEKPAPLLGKTFEKAFANMFN